jgi:hypothetical protein
MEHRTERQPLAKVLFAIALSSACSHREATEIAAEAQNALGGSVSEVDAKDACTPTTTLTASDGFAGDRFGASVAIEGKTALVGAAEGAYVFERARRSWGQETKLVPTSSFTGHLSISGDTAALTTEVGVTLFTRCDGEWHVQQEIALAPPPEAVALSGETLLVAHPIRVYVFDGATWNAQAELPSPPNSGPGVCLECPIALAGDTAIVGAPFFPFNGVPTDDVGTGSIFERSGTAWSETSLGRPLTSYHARVGAAVAASDGTLLVGATGAHSSRSDGALVDTRTFGGTTLVYGLEGGSWVQQQVLSPRDHSQGANFGNAIALSGNRALIRSTPKAFIDGSIVASNSIYSFELDGEDWKESAKLVAPTPVNQTFGSSLAVSGTTGLVGVPGDDSVPGEVLVYWLEARGCSGRSSH